MPNSYCLPDTTRQCCLCRVRRCELSRPDRPSGAFCVGVRPAVAPTVPAPPDTLRRWTHLSGRLSSHRHTRREKTVLSVSCLVCRCELDDCSFPQTPSFLALQGVHSATTAYCHCTQGDSDVISFHIYASWFFTAILWVKLLEKWKWKSFIRYGSNACWIHIITIKYRHRLDNKNIKI